MTNHILKVFHDQRVALFSDCSVHRMAAYTKLVPVSGLGAAALFDGHELRFDPVVVSGYYSHEISAILMQAHLQGMVTAYVDPTGLDLQIYELATVVLAAASNPLVASLPWPWAPDLRQIIATGLPWSFEAVYKLLLEDPSNAGMPLSLLSDAFDPAQYRSVLDRVLNAEIRVPPAIAALMKGRRPLTGDPELAQMVEAVLKGEEIGPVGHLSPDEEFAWADSLLLALRKRPQFPPADGLDLDPSIMNEVDNAIGFAVDNLSPEMAAHFVSLLGREYEIQKPGMRNAERFFDRYGLALLMRD